MFAAPEIDVKEGGGDVSRGKHDVDGSGGIISHLWTEMWRVSGVDVQEGEGDVLPGKVHVDWLSYTAARHDLWEVEASKSWWRFSTAMPNSAAGEPW